MCSLFFIETKNNKIIILIIIKVNFIDKRRWTSSIKIFDDDDDL